VLAPGPVLEDGKGLWLSGRIFQAFERRVAGLDGLSIAFRSLAGVPLPDGGTDHLRVHLTEVSVTDRPVVPGATAVIYGRMA
jgi:phage head maturation protease